MGTERGKMSRILSCQGLYIRIVLEKEMEQKKEKEEEEGPSFLHPPFISPPSSSAQYIFPPTETKVGSEGEASKATDRARMAICPLRFRSDVSFTTVLHMFPAVLFCAYNWREAEGGAIFPDPSFRDR